MASSSSKKIVLIALVANLGIAVAKFFAAALSQSSAMLSEAIHSLVDTSNQALLLYGLHRSQRPADGRHPFGYSREIYFWSFVVAVLLFSMGAGVSIYEGIAKLRNPHPVTDFWLSYIVLVFAIALEGYSAFKAITAFHAYRGRRSWISALRASKDAALFTVLLEDVAAVTGLLIALIALLCVQLLGWHHADAIASILIGLILASVAAFMSIEVKGLLVGEAVSPKVLAGIERILAREIKPSGPLLSINEIRTMHLGPDDVLVAASVDAIDGIPAEDVEAVTSELERTIKAKYPEVRRLFIETQSVAGHKAAVAADHRRQQPGKTKPAEPADGKVDKPPTQRAPARRTATTAKASGGEQNETGEAATTPPPNRKARKRTKRQN
ncbi:MAG TPA: cation diffusion facilitator family transporter [Pirellulales bacterium]|nr:cation diffusion facilitator family transporter [Pirellulales bacterium]